MSDDRSLSPENCRQIADDLDKNGFHDQFSNKPPHAPELGRGCHLPVKSSIRRTPTVDRFLSINPNLQQIISALTKGVVIPDDQYLVIDPYKKQLSYFGEDELRRAVFPNATVVGRDGTQIDPNVPENLTIVQIKLLTKDVFYPYQHIPRN